MNMQDMMRDDVLWAPSEEMVRQSNMKKYMDWLKEHKGLSFSRYEDLWEWSVRDIRAFWASLWEFFRVESSTPYERVLTDGTMPDVQWFPGATLNFAQHVFREMKPGRPAIIHASELRSLGEWSWDTLRDSVAALAARLKSVGVRPGDRVAAYAPNIPEMVASVLACASIGAIWSSCAAEFGTQSVTDRFRQIEPKVLIATDGYMYGGKPFDRMSQLRQIREELPTLKEIILIPYLRENPDANGFKDCVLWQQVMERHAGAELTFEAVPFSHPLWILYSSGTTGKPKGIVHSQGGILLEHLKFCGLHLDLKETDRFFWFTTTGWMMWNVVVSGLLMGSAIVLYDGNPFHPDHEAMWRLAEDAGITVFGTSAAYLTACMKAGLKPKEKFDLTALRSIGSTGSPLPESGFRWVYEHVKKEIWLVSTSGGTDVCSGFLGGCPLLPVHAGELQARALGAAVRVFDAEGKELIDEIGELVLTEPMPSMPVFFWNDKNGERYRGSYFDVYPGIWRHGDFLKITSRGSAIIYGRSDATINRGGVRMGTSEIYDALQNVPEVLDSLVVDVPVRGAEDGESRMYLFAVLKEGAKLTEELKERMKRAIRENCSPRHVPNEILEVPDLPKTLNGKKVEVPVKKILMGVPADQAVNPDSLANPEALKFFADLKLT